MTPSTERLHVGHIGCYAAIPGLSVMQDAAVARGKTGVLLCLELSSLHLQPPTDELEQVVAHALVADAAAAVSVQPDAAGLRIIGVVARTDAREARKMTWDITDRGFRMGLSPQVPQVLARHVSDVASELLSRNGLALREMFATGRSTPADQRLSTWSAISSVSQSSSCAGLGRFYASAATARRRPCF